MYDKDCAFRLPFASYAENAKHVEKNYRYKRRRNKNTEREKLTSELDLHLREEMYIHLTFDTNNCRDLFTDLK